MSRALAELLFRDRIITQAQFTDATAAMKTGKSAIRHLIETRQIADHKLLLYLTQKFNLTSINLTKFEIPPDVIRLLSMEQAKKLNCLPIQKSKGTLILAICDPTQIHLLEDLKFQLKTNIEVVLTSHSSFDAAVMRYYGGMSTANTAIESFRKEQKESEGPDGGVQINALQVHEITSSSHENDAPVISYVNSLLSEAVRRSASDIHVESFETRVRVRMRVDGTLIEIAEAPAEMKRAVIARLKVMASMDVGESRIPQDGRIKLRIGSYEIDFRVSTMPCLFGEKVVLRLLAKGNLFDLSKIGMDSSQLARFRKAIDASQGMVLVTGPTGSGKTTTLYSGLAELNKINDNLSTVEDPVEYNLEGINQVQVQKEIGLTFANVLRTLLRQDPDIILVGEIRDYETAEVAIQAALTGHLVLSTLHTNDSVSTITRLTNMGIEPFLIAASVNAIVAQRLIRTLCTKCKQPIAMSREQMQAIGIPDDWISNAKFFKATGCGACNKTGYKGRASIFEVFEISPGIREMILGHQSIIEIKKQAIKEGMQPLRQSGIRKAVEGHTSLEEVVTMTMEH